MTKRLIHSDPDFAAQIALHIAALGSRGKEFMSRIGIDDEKLLTKDAKTPREFEKANAAAAKAAASQVAASQVANPPTSNPKPEPFVPTFLTDTDCRTLMGILTSTADVSIADVEVDQTDDSTENREGEFATIETNPHEKPAIQLVLNALRLGR
jgi:hypothetical protein